jgi:hypothetical protein
VRSKERCCLCHYFLCLCLRLDSKMVNVTDHLPFNLQNRDDPSASTSRLRAESPSPHPSVGTTETMTTSRSNSSLRPRGGRFGPPKEPALSVRLVRGRDGNHRGGTSRGRLGRFGEERGVEWTPGSANGTEGSVDPKGVSELRVSGPDTVPPEVVPLEDPDRENVSCSTTPDSGHHAIRLTHTTSDLDSFCRNWKEAPRWMED